METLRILYHELFTIRFLHEGFNAAHNSFISDGIRIEPDKETETILANLGITYRIYSDSFVCFIRSKRVAPPANQPQLPYIENKEETRLRFLMYASNVLISKTFVAHAGGKSMYYFSNRTNNIDPGPPANIYLHRKIQPFNISKDYLEGTIVEDIGDMYAARKSVNHIHNIAITNEEFWEDVGDADDQWVNNADLETTAFVQPSENCFGVIDIFNTGTVNGYHLFNGAGQLVSPVYILSLKSRI
jgi:hypothetical protein